MKKVRQVATRLRVSTPERAAAVALVLLSAVGICAVAIWLFRQPSHGVLVARRDHLVWRGSSSAGPRSPTAARASFELDNVGRTPVRILSVESGCGCARPVVRPELVAPGQSAVVEVIAMVVPVGEKVLPFKVRTDSPTKPEVDLSLKLVGARKPPFLYLLEGEAVFRGDYSAAMSREIAVLTVENLDRGSAPEIRIEPSFLRSTLVDVESRPFIEPGTVLRKWKYRIEFAERPPSGTFQGVLVARGPWDHDDTLSMSVVGQLQSGPRAFPSAITLDRSGRGTASLVVVCRSPSGKLDIRTEPSSPIPLIVEEDPGDGGNKVHRVTIRLKRPLESNDLRSWITIRERDTTGVLEIPIHFTSRE